MTREILNNRYFIIVNICTLIALGFWDQASADDSEDAFPIMETQTARPMHADRHLLIGLGGLVGVRPNRLYGGTLAIGYQPRRIGIDVRGTYAKAQLSGIYVSPSLSDLGEAGNFPSATNSDSELNRNRKKEDPWSFWTVEPGLNVQFKYMPDKIPSVSQRVRGGFAYGQFTDILHGVTLTSYLVSVEAALQWDFTQSSVCALEAGLNWHFGWLRNQKLPSSNLGHLPVTYVTPSLRLLFWL